jgi:putative PEP-CTERM system TPR-repeat lipoprotein
LEPEPIRVDEPHSAVFWKVKQDKAWRDKERRSTSVVGGLTFFDLKLAKLRVNMVAKKKYVLACSVLVSWFLIGVTLQGCSDSSSDRIARAQDYADSRDFRAAVLELKSLLQVEPDSAQARWLLATVYIDVEDGASAEKELRRSRALGVGDDAVLPMLAWALLLQNKFDDVLDIKPDGPVSKRAIAEIEAAHAIALVASDNPERAQELIDAAEDRFAESQWVQLAKSLVLYSQNELDQARQTVLAVVAREPTNGPAWSLLGDIESGKGEFAAAETAYSSAIELRANPTRDRIRRGWVRLSQGDTDGANADAKKLAPLADKSADVSYFVGALRLSEQNLTGAIDALEVAHSLAPELIRPVYLLSLSHYRAGNKERAQVLAERVVGAVPGFPAGRKLLAAVHLSRGQGARAEELLKPMWRAVPQDLEVANALAASLILQGKRVEAVELLTNVASGQTDDAVVQLRAGLGLLAAGSREKAEESLARAGQSVSAGDRLLEFVAAGLLKANAVDQALEVATQYLQAHQDDPAAWNLIGLVHMAKGDLNEAKSSFEESLSLQSVNPEARENLAAAYQQSGDWEQALVQIDTGLRQSPENARLLYKRATFDVREGRPDIALMRLEAAISAAPQWASPRVDIARLLTKRGDHAAALSHLTGGRFDRDYFVLLARAEAYVGLREYVSARRTLEAATDLAPRRLRPLLLLIEVNSSLNDQSALSQSINRASALAPNHPQVGLAKARLLILENRFAEARALVQELEMPDEAPGKLSTLLYLERAAGNNSEALRLARLWYENSPSTQTALAMVTQLGRSGLEAEQKVFLIDWVRSNPDDLIVAELLVKLYLKTGDQESAVELLKSLVEIHPNNPSANNNLAWALRESNPTAALRYSEKAVEFAPNSVPILDTYIEVLIRNGLNESALRTIDRAISLSATDEHGPLRLRRIRLLYSTGRESQAVREAEDVARGDYSADVTEAAQVLLNQWASG